MSHTHARKAADDTDIVTDAHENIAVPTDGIRRATKEGSNMYSCNRIVVALYFIVQRTPCMLHDCLGYIQSIAVDVVGSAYM